MRDGRHSGARLSGVRSLVALSVVLFLFGVVASAQSDGAQLFKEVGLEADFRIEQPVLRASLTGEATNDLVLVGQDAEHDQWLAVYGLVEASEPRVEAVVSMKADPEWTYFDVGRLGDQEGLYFLTPGRILRYDFSSSELVEVVRIKSIYRLERVVNLEHQDFFRDINGDELDDLIVPDLEGLRVRLQTTDGELGEEVLLSEGVGMHLVGPSAHYNGRPNHSADMNFDGLVDFVVRRDLDFHVYAQEDGPRFQSEDFVAPINLDLPTEARLRALDADAVDQSELTVKSISKVQDLNGDGLLDIITDATYSAGVFDKRNEFRLHLGRRDGERLVFDDEEDSLLSSKGLQFDMILTDVNRDGREDLVIPSVRLSFGRVIGALFSGSVSLDLRFYKMSEDDRYPADPNYDAKVKVHFDLTSGQVDIPTIKVDDFDGDGLEDLIFQIDRDEVALYRGENTEQLFAHKAVDVKLPLPRNGELVETMDVNGDDKSDLVIRYDTSDGEGKINTVRLMLAL